jgi:hypothetical protein
VYIYAVAITIPLRYSVGRACMLPRRPLVRDPVALARPAPMLRWIGPTGGGRMFLSRGRNRGAGRALARAALVGRLELSLCAW